MIAKFLLQGARRRLTPRLNPFASFKPIFRVIHFLARKAGLWPKESRRARAPRSANTTPDPRTRPLGEGGHIDIRRLLIR